LSADVHSSHPTPYAEVNAVLQLLLSRVSAVLGSALVGIYLDGSLAWGDFDPESSDVDFLIVTDGELSSEPFEALKAMHTEIAASGLKWAKKLEGVYIPKAALRRYDPAHARHPTLNLVGDGWEFGIDAFDSDWTIHLHILRERGIVLCGPRPQTLIDPVTTDELRQATVGSLFNWWAQQLEHPERLLGLREYQDYAVLTMCRILYTVEHGEVASKPVAAAWAQEALGLPWAPLIACALRFRGRARQQNDLAAVLRFIRHTMERCHKEGAK